MGRKRKSAKSSKKRSSFNLDLAVITLLMLSILLFVLIYGETGAIGEILSPMLGGIIGFIKYLIPIGMLALAVCVAKDNRDYVISKLVQYVIFLSCIAAMMTIFQISKGTISVDLEFSEVLQVAYDLGEKNIGGGTVGIVLAYPLIKLFGMFGAAIAAVGTAIILLIFTFGIEPSKLLIAFIDKVEEEREGREEERMHHAPKNKSFTEFKEARKELKRKDDEQISQENFEDQITINLNNSSDNQENVEEEKAKFSIFSKGNKEELKAKPAKANPNEIEANLFKQEEEVKESRTKEVLTLAHNEVSIEDENYEFPPIELMKLGETKSNNGGKKILADTATKLQKTLLDMN